MYYVMKERKKPLQTKPKFNFNNSYINLPKLFYTKQSPTPVRSPKLIIFNDSLANSLKVPLQPEVFAGNEIPEEANPLAQAYAGHQFGHFTMLGDGRAILLGEVVTDSLERFDITLKGSGKTPYSRGGDGRAAIGPMLREYIVSEAMHTLGIPTTRSLAVVETGEVVVRKKPLRGAILARVAKSHIRVGTFEYAARFGTTDDVRDLADYTINRHFSDIASSENKYLLMLREVINRQAYLISKWQLVGFIHGVMNTDNMAISGETIDYGPCAFMDICDPSTVFSSIDIHGRYSYENQPKMATWNLARFTETLLPLLHNSESLAIKIGQEELKRFWEIYENNWLSGMRAKLGLFDEEQEDGELINDILQIMYKFEADYTNTFRSLTLENYDDNKFFSSDDFNNWNIKWQRRLLKQKKSKVNVVELMKKHNPSVIPRNHLVEEALEHAESGDLSTMNKLLDVLKNPYKYTPEQEEYTKLDKLKSCNYQTFCGT